MAVHQAQEYDVGGAFRVRPLRFEFRGDLCPLHHHNFDHALVVKRGALAARIIRVRDDGYREVVKQVIRRASDNVSWFLVRATELHEIEALEDESWGDCCFSHKDPQGQIILHADGWTPAYDNYSGKPVPGSPWLQVAQDANPAFRRIALQP